MSSNIILVAETGSDITPELAKEYGIWLVPMYVTMGDQTLDDGTFPAEDVCAYYDHTGKVPKTSGTSPEAFERVFREIHEKYPEKHILHLAYSAVTTVSYQSAVIAAEGLDYVTSLDTKQVSVGQAAAVLEVARFLQANPEVSVEEAVAAAEKICRQTQMCFIPKNLDYLRAGGRVSNVAALTGNLLQLHPCIEIIDGRLMAKKKYRGAMEKFIPTLLSEFDEKHSLSREKLYLISTPYMDETVREVLGGAARSMGFRKIIWMRTGCVITCHSGPGAFGVVGFAKE